jgi:chemotaxis protein MotA
MTVSRVVRAPSSKGRAKPILGHFLDGAPRSGRQRLAESGKVPPQPEAPSSPAVLPREETFRMIQAFDPLSAAIVFGGTAAATLLRCGWKDVRAAVHAIANLLAPAFDSDSVRAELALQIQEIGEDGLIRAEAHRFGDGEFDDLSEALVRHRSIEALYEQHERHRGRRISLAGAADRALSEAAELAPVLGLAGTLLSLGGLSSAAADGDYARAIGTAVNTTLYGLIAANFIFAPLAAIIERRARAEERARHDLLTWLAAAIERAAPQAHKSPSSRAAA